MSLRVIGAGFGRTGTLSLKHALETLLGGRCYHMMEVIENGHADFWLRKARGEAVDFEQVLGDYVAAVDWPTTRFYADLAERYPEAKVVLSVRDPGRWYESAKDSIFELSKIVRQAPQTWLTPLSSKMRAMPDMVHAVVWDGEFDGRFADRDYAISVFEAHTEAVKRTIPAERLLVYEIRDGWEPLCEFLELPVPSEPMPRVNDREAMQKRLRIMKVVAHLAAPLTLPLSLARRAMGASSS
ncbi:sulfotransferase family protein [Pseudenhygromyxa sp. WMMC2535]|uniref:sulfotransferase family protein n=1 Tax=Pseudenhygromyxa sp. WMMC2535 TaxID=2712867 RepID=UPI001553CA7E|nr:sulfotransferase family protein [Pseudenhygromyxa sp. WMMC2535]NVB39172.1 sulfotransferase family protein [Pseudenhygromyxa sp. WMMC2535]